MDSYIDYQTAKEQLSILRVAEQLGYTLNRAEGLRYPVYELRQGDAVTQKVVITRPNDPSSQGYFVRSTGERGDLISFIEHRLDFFPNATGSTTRERINRVLTGLMGGAPSQTTVPTHYAQARQQIHERPFSPDNYRYTPINPTHGVALLEERGITRETLELFRPFVGWAKEEGKPQYNLAFPYRIPGHPDVANYELRYTKADGTGGKLFSKGGNRKESAFMARWNNDASRIKNTYLFEAVIDLMSFVQLHPEIDRSESAFVAFGGAITRQQITGVRDQYIESNFVTCYDNDLAGHQFDIQTAAYLLDEEVKMQKRRNEEVYDISFRNETFELPTAELTLDHVLAAVGIARIEELSVLKPDTGKDWNDRLMTIQHPIRQNTTTTTMIMEEKKRRQQSPVLDDQKRFNETYARILSSGTMEVHAAELLGMLDQLNAQRTKEGLETLHMEKLESYRENNSPGIHSQNNNTMETQSQEKEPLFRIDQINWADLEKIGIHESFLSKENEKTHKSHLDMLLQTGKTGVIKAYHKVSDTLTLKTEGKLTMYESSTGEVKMAFDSVKKFLDIPDRLLGYTFTEEDRQNLQQEHNLFKRVELKGKNEKPFNAYIGVDPDMKTLTMALQNEIYFRKIAGVELSEEQQEVLKSGQPLYVKDMKRKDDTLFSCYLVVDPNKKSLSMVSAKPRIVQAEKQSEAPSVEKPRVAQPPKQKAAPQEEKKQNRGKRM